MKNLLFILILIASISCKKEEVFISEQSKNGLPEINLHSLTITDSLIIGTISNISEENYLSEVHGPVYLILIGRQGTINNSLDNDALKVIRKGHDYCFEISNPFESEGVIVVGSFEDKYSTK